MGLAGLSSLLSPLYSVHLSSVHDHLMVFNVCINLCKETYLYFFKQPSMSLLYLSGWSDEKLYTTTKP
jgi:hypothetical protein